MRKRGLNQKGDIIASPTEYLADWIARFVKNKDLIVKNIQEISQKEELVIAKLKDGKEHKYLIEPFLDNTNLDSALDKIKNSEHCSLVVYNTKEAFDTVIKNWEKLAKFKRHFNIYFVNPFSKTEKRWSLYPMTHDLITDDAWLKPGLLSIFATVDVTTKEEIEKVLKTSS